MMWEQIVSTWKRLVAPPPIKPRRDGIDPCSASEAVERARSLINKGGQYILGTGDYRRSYPLPWTQRMGQLGSDCAGFAICWCYRLIRHRPGFASGRVPEAYRDQSDVDDDINCNSLIEDALTTREICELVTDEPQLGDLIVYPTIRIKGVDGEVHTFIGHVGIVIGNKRAQGRWDWQHPPYRLLDIAQCKGPNGRAPAVVQTDGSIWEAHDAKWPKPSHRTCVIRMKAA
jgi:hypothetical protein